VHRQIGALQKYEGPYRAYGKHKYMKEKKFNIVFLYFSEIENDIYIHDPIKRRVKVRILHLSNKTNQTLYVLSLRCFTLEHDI
jgi:hypothetical protein